MTWGNSQRRTQLPLGWARLRADVLTRDQHTCRLRHRGCTITATEVHHLDPDDHDPSRLVSACAPCHAIETRRQSASALRARAALGRMPAEPHPGLT